MNRVREVVEYIFSFTEIVSIINHAHDKHDKTKKTAGPQWHDVVEHGITQCEAPCIVFIVHMSTHLTCFRATSPSIC